MLVLLLALFILLWVAGVAALDSPALIALFLVASIPAFLLALWWFWIRIYYLPVPALMLEDVGIFGAIERGHALTQRAFWRIFGIAVLTAIITAIAGSMLGVPVSLVMDGLLSGGLDTRYAALTLTLVNAVTSVVQAAFVAPFTAAVTSLQYVDQRIRKEAFDVELMTRAGITACRDRPCSSRRSPLVATRPGRCCAASCCTRSTSRRTSSCASSAGSLGCSTAA